MMNIKMKTMLPAVIGVTAGVLIGQLISEKQNRKLTKRRDEIRVLLVSVKNVFKFLEIRNFNEFAKYLDEIYEIKVQPSGLRDEYIYFSSKFSKPIHSSEIVMFI